MDKNGYFVVKNLCCDFIKSAQLGDLLEVKNKVKVLKKASSVLEQSIYLKNKLIFKATLTIVYMINGKISKIPQDKLKYFHDKIS
jgi:acyl-CoA thioester hydrolase